MSFAKLLRTKRNEMRNVNITNSNLQLKKNKMKWIIIKKLSETRINKSPNFVFS